MVRDFDKENKFLTPRNALAIGGSYFSPQVNAKVKLNTNESAFPPPLKFQAQLSNYISQLALHRYPDRYMTQLREALGEFHECRPEQVWCANGSNEIISQLVTAFGGAGDSALIFTPTYAMHSVISKLHGLNTISSIRQKDYRIDLTLALREIQRLSPKIVFLCTPNNPTGVEEDSETVEAIISHFSGLVILDEAYYQFGENDHSSLIGRYPNVAIVRTFSKTWALAGLRLGYVLSNENIIKALAGVSLPYHLNAVSQIAGVLALKFHDDMKVRVAEVVSERKRIEEQFKDLGIHFCDSGANFIMFDPGMDAHVVWEKLLSKSVLIRDLSSFEGLKNKLRVTVGTKQENDEFLNALREVLN